MKVSEAAVREAARRTLALENLQPQIVAVMEDELVGQIRRLAGPEPLTHEELIAARSRIQATFGLARQLEQLKSGARREEE